MLTLFLGGTSCTPPPAPIPALFRAESVLLLSAAIVLASLPNHGGRLRNHLFSHPEGTVVCLGLRKSLSEESLWSRQQDFPEKLISTLNEARAKVAR